MTSPIFPLPINGQFSDDGERFILDMPFVYNDDEKDYLIEVPAGFETDFNSVPRAFWGYFPPWQFLDAGVVHDFLYRYPGNLSREECDDIHRRILHLKGCRWTKRQLAYLALRSGGWKPWNKYRKMEEDAAKSA